MRSPAASAQLALLFELAATPTPGNVDRHREYADLRFEHFLAGAVGARPGLEVAAAGEGIGEAFETAVAGMARAAGTNTQFGALLVLAALVRAAATDRLSPAGLTDVVAETTVADAAGFYRAFEHVDVAVDDPPPEVDLPDVRRGADAVPDLEAAGTTLGDVMSKSADVDGLAAEYASGFERTFAAVERIERAEGTALERVAAAQAWLLADRPDTHVATVHGAATAERVRERAAAARAGGSLDTLAADLVAEGVNPGTTADLTAGATFVAIQRGVLAP